MVKVVVEKEVLELNGANIGKALGSTGIYLYDAII